MADEGDLFERSMSRYLDALDKSRRAYEDRLRAEGAATRTRDLEKFIVEFADTACRMPGDGSLLSQLRMEIRERYPEAFAAPPSPKERT